MPKSLKKIYLLFALISIGLAIIILFFYSKRIFPYRLVLYKGGRSPISTEARILYHDLDKDGFEEKIILTNSPSKHLFYIKIYQEYKSGLLDQFNFANPLITRAPAFFDVNNDGWDDIIVFSHDNKALYLSIIDAKKQSFIQKETFLVPASPKRARKRWDIHSIYPKIVDLENSGHKRLLFALNSGYAKLPRCLCLYDFRLNKIVRRFDHYFGPVEPFVVNLNRDQFDEIVLFNYATNNFPEHIPFSDAFSWYVVLDHNLHLLKPPSRLGGKFSLVKILPARNTLYLVAYGTHSPNALMRVDSTYEITRVKKINILRMAAIDRPGDTPSIYVTFRSDSAGILDSDLTFRKKIRFPETQGNLVIETIQNIIGSPQPELLCFNVDGLFLYDMNWNLLAQYLFKKSATTQDVYIIKRPDIPTPIITLTHGVTRYQLLSVPNKYYKILKWNFFVLSLLIFLFLSFAFQILERIWRYISSFSYLLKKSDNAIILLDYKGRVISVNKKVNRFLKLTFPLRTGDRYQSSLKQRPEIVEAIQTCEKNLKQVQKTFSFDDPLGTFIGEVTVTPFLTLFQFVYAYLVEIKDSTEHVLAERQLNWQRNIRRMVHDIKTPLAGVQLKLQMLFMKLAEEHPQLKENIFNELEDAYSELKRIRNISKDFLKFSDLEMLKIDEIDIVKFVENVLIPFQLYNNELMHIKINIEAGVPKTVYWDKRQIEILLHIIIENAIDALQGKGEIIIEVRPSPEIRNEVLPWVEFRIQDNGPGIPEKIQSKIFEPHFSTKKEGSGLGLSFAKHIVEQHHGKISFYSSPNTGSVFIVILPVRFTAESSSGE
jgi:signal transduction histidine kinase